MADSSRIPGFYKDPLATRRERLAAARPLLPETVDHLACGGGLDPAVADRMSENVVGCHGLPLSIGLNFLVNGRDLLVPMAVEEPSVVAAASNAARMVRTSGGFFGEATAPIMTAQIQLDEVPDPASAAARVAARTADILAAGDAAIPSMIARGGGCRDVEARALEDGLVVVHVYVDVGDAMGANVVDAVAEGAAAVIQAAVGGRIGLRILSNLPVRRMVRVRAHVPDDAIGGAELAAGIARASRFAELDVYRAATHNKGVMNGIDAVALALGQDWRALEAGAHSFAALSGRYRPLATWRRMAGGVDGVLEMPLAAATAGGSTRAHAGVRAAFDVLGVASARELAVVMGAVGLASNLAALRALAGEGIQRGHMKLHERKRQP
jgi:hydroxymethylglutaryl-CoA reductase